MICLPIFGEFISSPTIVDTPEGRPAPPKNLLCPGCNTISNTNYRKYSRQWRFCIFLNVCCQNSSIYLACGNCGYNLGSSRIHSCQKCGIKSIAASSFCLNCGHKNVN